MMWIKRKISNFLLKYLLGFVVLDDIITVDRNGNILIAGKLITENELRAMQAEIKAMRGFAVWRVMSETLKEDAYKRGFTTATSLDHLDACKSMLYNLDFQDSIMRIIESKR